MSQPSALVAVVDDDDSFREAMAGLVVALGFRVAAFATARAFLDSDARRETVCLVSDVNMPGMNGFDLQDHLRSHGARIPTILVTAIADDARRAAALAAGAAGFLAKPVDGDELLALIRALSAA